MKKSQYVSSFLLAVLLVSLYAFSGQTASVPSPLPRPAVSLAPEVLSVSSDSAKQIAQRTKVSGCRVLNGVQDNYCTPGSIFPEVTKDQVCVSGYSSSVRNVPESEKVAVYKEYGIETRTTGEFEVDHLISLELGGSNDIANLWPEAAEPRPGFHEKDKVENFLHQQVCSGQISLEQAQSEIAHDWLTVYQNLP